MGENLKYPWQQSVVDAIAEIDPYRQSQKIAAAEKTLAARLAETLDAEEQHSLRNALTTLKLLFEA